jgi:hypothetical protein
MISRRIPCLPENDDYRRLARYIADASHDCEKALMSWCAGCWSDDEYELAIKEVELVQAMNIRTSKEKTYHLMISFRPEDEAKLTSDIFQAIELEFAKTLGFDEHQRHCGVHKNTSNIHLHISYNQIHPISKNRHEPYRDFWKRDSLCRQLEQKYGLTVDNGRDPESDKPLNEAAMSFEAQTGQESLFGYTQRHKPAILAALENSKSWADCHRTFMPYGLALKLHGNGLIIQTADGHHSIKASGFDRSISKTKLEKRFGAFTSASPDLTKSDSPAEKYTAAPLHKDPNRDKLYEQFKTAMAERQAALAEIGKQGDRLYAIYRQTWEKKREKIKRMPMLRKHRREVMEKVRAQEKTERAALRKTVNQKREAVRILYPFNSWSKFLQHQASQGHETALAILRSKKEKALPDRPSVSTHNQTSATVANTALASVTQMRELFRSEGIKTEPQYSIASKGTIIFKLPNGGSIRDTGTEVHFTASNEQAKRIATNLAQFRWGQAVSIEGNVLKNPLLMPMLHHQAQNHFNGIGR